MESPLPLNPYPWPHGEFPMFNNETKHKPELCVSLYSRLAQLKMDGASHWSAVLKHRASKPCCGKPCCGKPCRGQDASKHNRWHSVCGSRNDPSTLLQGARGSARLASWLGMWKEQTKRLKIRGWWEKQVYTWISQSRYNMKIIT